MSDGKPGFDRDVGSVASAGSRVSDKSRNRLGVLAQQRSVLLQLQEVTARWREEKTGLLAGFEEERSIWTDTKRELEEEVQDLEQRWAAATTELLQAKATTASTADELATLQQDYDKLKRIALLGKGGSAGGFTDFDALASTRAPRIVDLVHRKPYRPMFWQSSSRAVNAVAGSVIVVLVSFFLGEVRHVTGFSTQAAEWSLLKGEVWTRAWPPTTSSVVYFFLPLASLALVALSAALSIMSYRLRASLPILQCMFMSCLLYGLGRTGLWLSSTGVGTSGLIIPLLTPAVASTLVTVPPLVLGLMSDRRPVVLRTALSLSRQAFRGFVWVCRAFTACFSGLLTLQLLFALSSPEEMSRIVRWSVPTVLLSAWYPSAAMPPSALHITFQPVIVYVTALMKGDTANLRVSPEELRLLCDGFIFFVIPLFAFLVLIARRLWTAFAWRRGYRALSSVVPSLASYSVLLVWIWGVTFTLPAANVSACHEDTSTCAASESAIPEALWLLAACPSVWLASVALARMFGAASAGLAASRLAPDSDADDGFGEEFDDD